MLLAPFVFDRFGSPLFIGVPKTTLFSAYPMGSGVTGKAGAKSLREDDDGDAHGRRHLLGGIAVALTMLPCLEHRGEP
jgi:hypothetical protein